MASMDVNLLTVVAATVAGFIVSFAYYSLFGAQLEEYGSAAAGASRPTTWLVPVELVRTLVVAAVVVGLAGAVGVTGLPQGVLLAVVLWVGFPAVLLTGSVYHERTPWRLAALHAGDWLVKLLVMGVVAGVWQ